MTQGLLIDWLTLRFPLGDELGAALTERVRSCLGLIVCVDSDGVEKWRKSSLDVDALRSDTEGLVWMMQGDGKNWFLTIGGSPASLTRGCNVFGSLDIRFAAWALIQRASKALNAILPVPERWQCRRIDITGNYAFDDHGSVKQALRMLLNTDGSRRKAASAKKGGDTVSWNPTSDLQKGKAYHKGPQLAKLQREGNTTITDDMVSLADKLLRLEYTAGARWFRRAEQAGLVWWQQTAEQLSELHRAFFEPLVGGVEVRDMGRRELLEQIRTANGITEGRALAVFNTYRGIRSDGYEDTAASMGRSTFFRHMRFLRRAGISDADLRAGNIIPFRSVRILLGRAVSSWAEIRRAA